MSEIYLTKEQYNKRQYKGSTVTRGKTYGNIIGKLEEHGIKDYEFTKIGETEVLKFPLKVKRNEMEVGFIVKMTVPRLMYPVKLRKGRNAPTKMTYLEKESWRIFFWYLKSKLEAIEYGISDEVKEFMYNISYALPDGREIKLGEVILENADRLNNLIALPETKDMRTIDVEYEVIEENEQ